MQRSTAPHCVVCEQGRRRVARRAPGSVCVCVCVCFWGGSEGWAFRVRGRCKLQQMQGAALSSLLAAASNNTGMGQL
jgi:hypothetical protein